MVRGSVDYTNFWTFESNFVTVFPGLVCNCWVPSEFEGHPTIRSPLRVRRPFCTYKKRDRYRSRCTYSTFVRTKYVQCMVAIKTQTVELFLVNKVPTVAISSRPRCVPDLHQQHGFSVLQGPTEILLNQKFLAIITSFHSTMPIDVCIEKVDIFLSAHNLPNVQMFR